MGFDFVGLDGAGELTADLGAEGFEAFVGGATEVVIAGEDAFGAAVEGPEEGFLEGGPEGLAGRHGVGEGVEGEKVQVFRGLDGAGEVADDLGVIEVEFLGEPGHEEVMADEEGDGGGGWGGKAEAAGLGEGDAGAFGGVIAGVGSLADVVEEEGEVENVGAIQGAEHFGVGGEGLFAGVPDPVEDFEADQGVFVGGVEVVELVLNAAGQAVEGGHVLGEETGLVHGTEDAGDVPAPIEDFEESLVNAGIGEELAIDEGEVAADGVLEIGMEGEAELLGVEEGADEAAGLVAEDAGG